MSSDPGADERRARRAELRRRQVRRRRATGAALLVAVGGHRHLGGRHAGVRRQRRAPADSVTDDRTLTGDHGRRDHDALGDDHGHDGAPRPPPDLGSHSVTIAWVGDTVLASKYGTPPDAGRRSMAPVVGPLRSADLAFGNLEETLSAAARDRSAAARRTASRSRRRPRTRSSCRRRASTS